MSVQFVPPARAEFREAYLYYQAERMGLARDFALEVARVVREIHQHPKRWPKISRNVRRCRTNRFPYGVLYAEQGANIVVVAVMHLHQRPGYWKRRV